MSYPFGSGFNPDGKTYSPIQPAANPIPFGGGWSVNPNPVNTIPFGSGVRPNSGYPTSTPGYPLVSPNYPSSNSGYPPTNSSYSPPNPALSPTNSGYPPSNPGYPPQNSGYPPQNSGYPPTNSGYPPSNTGYPPNNAVSPSRNPGYPSNNPGYPTSNPGYPPSNPGNPGYPPSNPGNPQSNQRHPSCNLGYPSSTPGNPKSNAGNNSSNFNAGYPLGNAAPNQGVRSSPGHQATITQTRSANPSPVKTQYSSPTRSEPKSSYPRQHQSHSSQTHSYSANYSVKPPNPSINWNKGRPSVVAAPNFDATADAKALRKAMKGFGTDEEGLINIVCRRSNEQRQEIQLAYKTNFGKDLIDDIKSETSGNFEALLVALCRPIIDFYVHEIHDAMAGIGTDEDVLIEVLCSLSNYEINVIKLAYRKKYGKDLEKELISETSGHFKRMLVSLCMAGRDESNHTDEAAANKDATDLLRAGELRVGTDEGAFNAVLCQRNYAQLRLVLRKYEEMTGHDLEQAIDNEFSGDIKNGLKAIVQCVANKRKFFATRLKKSMAGIGTNDRQLIRVIVTRAEIDLLDIKDTFQETFNDSLRNWIKGDTSGHYKHALYVMIGENKS